MDSFSEIRQRPILKIPNLPNPVGELTIQNCLDYSLLLIFDARSTLFFFPIYERDQQQVFPEYEDLLTSLFFFGLFFLLLFVTWDSLILGRQETLICPV